MREAGECRLAESQEERKNLAGLCGHGILDLAKSDQPIFPVLSSWSLTLLRSTGEHYLLFLTYTMHVPIFHHKQEHSPHPFLLLEILLALSCRDMLCIPWNLFLNCNDFLLL